MGFLATLHQQRSNWSGTYNLKDPALNRLFGAGYEAYAGIPVTEANAFTFSAVFSAVLQISSDVAKLPLNLRKRRQDGGSDPYIDSKTYHLLKSEPNPEQSAMTFRQTLIAHALTCHGGYAEIERDINGRPAALWTLTPDRVEPFRREQYDRATGRKILGPLEYKIDHDDNQILPASNVLHISGLGYDGVTGYSIIHKARQAIGLALAMEKFGGQYFGKGTVFGGWLETDALDLEGTQKQEIIDEIQRFRNAQDSAFRILVTGAGHKFHQFASKPSESQMDESRTAQILEVARFFRMPPIRLGVNTPGTVSYASAEASNGEYYIGPLLDWMTRIEQECQRKLIPASERRQQFIKHNATAFLRGDTTARSAFYQAMLDRGVFCADDVLELEDMNPQPNGQGKLFLVQGAMIAKDQLISLTDAKIAQLEGSNTPPAPTPDPNAADVQRAIHDVSERLATLSDGLSALTGDQATRLETLQRDLEAARIEQVRSESAAAEAGRHVEAMTTLRDAAIAKAAQAEADAGTAAGDRDNAVRDAATARSEATAALLAAAEAERQKTEAIAAKEAAGAAMEDIRARLATLEAETASAREQAAEAERQRVEAEAIAQRERDAREASEREAIRVAEALTRDVAEIGDKLAESEATRARHASESGQIAAVVLERDVMITSLRESAAALEAEVASERQVREAAEQQVAASLEHLESLRGQIAAVEGSSAEAIAERERLSGEVATITAALEAERAQVAALKAQEARATAEAEEARQQLAGERASRIERLTRIIARHRGLILAEVGRMARRECQQARSKQATPEKLRRWLDGFVSPEAAICREALLPVMGVLLADTQDDPVARTEVLVAEHLAAFMALMRDVLAAPVEDFHAELDRALTRWETERPERVADALLEQEIRHVRAL